jgi:hypothetical protein
MSNHGEEGWCSDPFGRHEARWMSDGTPTKLVRDGGVESTDEPPDEEPALVATPISNPEPEGGYPGELESLERQMTEAAEYGATWGSHAPRMDTPGP